MLHCQTCIVMLVYKLTAWLAVDASPLAVCGHDRAEDGGSTPGAVCMDILDTKGYYLFELCEMLSD